MVAAKCAAWADDGGSAWNALKCVPLQRNPGVPGDPCTAVGMGKSGEDSCDVGVMCWDLNGEGQGTCVALCTSSAEAPSCAGECQHCVLANQAVLNLCLPECDPLGDDCMHDDHCIPDSGEFGGFVCVLDSSSTQGLFGPCEFVNACDKGLFCGDPADASECDARATGCCLPFCDPNGDACPGVGQACLPWPFPTACHAVHFCGVPR